VSRSSYAARPSARCGSARRRTKLRELVEGADVTIEAPEPSLLQITGLGSEQVGKTAAANGIVLYELVPQEASLEEAFMELTREEIEFHADTEALAAEPREAAA